MNAHAERSFELWEPKRALSLAQARRRTDIVYLLRALFTIGAAVSAGVLVGFIAASIASSGTTRASVSTVGVTMLNPRFDGRDASGRPFVVTADTARRRREDVNVIDLVNPKYDTAGGSTVTAREGVYDRTGQVLDLTNDVVLTDASGYEFRTTAGRMFIDDGRVEGASPLRGQGPIGEVVGDAYEVRDDGNRIILKGNVWSRINPSARETGE